MKKAVIFDMDGVIVFSEQLYRERRQLFFEQYDIILTKEDQDNLVGSNKKNMFQSLFPNQEEKQLMMRQAYEAFTETFTIDYRKILNKDIPVLLEELRKRKLKLAVASSGPYIGVGKVLEHNQIRHYFDFIVSGEDFAESKPHPEIYEYTIKKLQLPKEACIAIEDSAHGIKSAISAGIDVVALKDKTFGIDQQDATYMVDTVLEILDFIS